MRLFFFQSSLLLLFLVAPTSAQTSSAPDGLAKARSAIQEEDWSLATHILDAYLAEEDGVLEARYLRGVAYGERGKHPTLQSRMKRFLDRSEQDFAYVLARDSLYQDVLFQYAVVRQYAGDLEDAIRLAEEQLRLKPALAHARVGLHGLYWRFVVENEPLDARRWLRGQPGDRAQLFVGRTFERQGLYRAAEDIYKSLSTTDLSRVALLLARARVHFAWGKPVLGSDFMRQAINAIATDTDAHLLFEEIKTIVSPAETAFFSHLFTPSAYRDFFIAFWAKRDPMPAAPYNARLVEHYRRLRIAERDYLFYGYRAWFRSPFTHQTKLFPPTYALGQDFDDRGITFIRHGEPDDYTIGDANSWLYMDSLLVLHFAPTCIRGICSVSTHFTPVPQGETLSPHLVGMDVLEAERKSAEYLALGLTTDRHRWPESTTILEFPYVVASFRGMDRKSLVEVHYGIPFEDLRAEEGAVVVEVGMAVHDDAWRQHSLFREIKQVSEPVTDRFQVDLPIQDFNLALHIRSLESRRLGAHTQTYRPLRFDGAGLKMSDILLADTVLVLDDVATPTRNDLYIEVNAAQEFSTDDPVYVFYELYDLIPSPDAVTEYDVAYTLSPVDRSGRVQEDAITLRASTQKGNASSVIEYVGIDVTEVPRGRYELRITVTDTRTGDTATRTRRITLVR